MNIKTASEITHTSSSTIRYYENEGLIPPIPRNKYGVRRIDNYMLDRIKFVKEMRLAGMGISVLKKYIHLFDFEKNSQKEQLKLLKNQVEIMEEKRDDLQVAINHLHFKINHFYDHTLKKEKELQSLEKSDAKNYNKK